MDAKQLKRFKPELELFLNRYAPCFPQDAHGEQARKFVQGLLLGRERRNVENIAEAIEGGVVRSMQKFIGQGRWRDDPVQEELRQHIVEVLGDADAILNVDETGFPKKGTKSVGVKRQYAGCLGRVDNCQVGVFVNYRSDKGHTLIDRRLFLPEDWAADRARREEAGVPPDVVFRTKPELALEMIRRAVDRDTPFRWVTGDSIYGDSPKFVQGVRNLGKWYVVDSSADAYVWTEEPELLPPTSKRGGGAATPKVASKPEPVADVVARIPASAWKTITVAEGSQGPRVYEYTEMWVWFSEAGVPSGRERLLVRRSLDQKAECKFHRSNAPASVRMPKLAQVRGGHWSVEQSFEAGKGECGLDEYETRGWVGWHHHIILSMLALWFLSLQKQRLGEKRAAAYSSRGSGDSRPFAGHPAVGRTRDPVLVGVAAGAK